MSKRLTLSCLLALVGLIAAPAIAQNMLSNPGFETDGDADNVPDGWTMSGEVAYVGPCGGQPDPCYNTDPHGGDKMMMAATHWAFDTGTVEQTISVGAGNYDLALSFYAHIQDDSWFPSSVSGELIVGGEVVAAASLANAGGDPIPYTQMVATWQGTLTATTDITVRFTLIADGPGGGDSWGICNLDDVALVNMAGVCGAPIDVADVSIGGGPAVAPFVSVPATATITISGDVTDGDTIVIDKEVSQTDRANRIYEFDTNAVKNNANAVRVDVSLAQDKASAKAALIAAITADAQEAPCSAADGGGDVINLTWDTNGGDGAINEDPIDALGSIAVTSFSRPAQSATTVTIVAGANLGQVSAATLKRSGTTATTDVVVGSNLTMNGSNLEVDFVLDGLDAGFFDVILEQVGCNPRVIVGGVQIRDGSVQQNLLLNGSFEVKNNLGNLQIWGGDYISYSATSGARQHVPTPRVHDGIWGLEFHDGEGVYKETSTSQTVPVAAGDTVNFSGWLHAGPGDGGTTINTVTVNVWDGLPGGVLIGSTTVDDTTVPVAQWIEATASGTSNSGLVTVEITSAVQAGTTPGAVHIDHFTLTAEPCEAPHRPMFAYPSNGWGHLDVATIVIEGGTNLDLVSDARLEFVDEVNAGPPGDPISDEPEKTVTGVIRQPQSPTSITVDFDLGAGGAWTGPYNLLVEQPSCPTPNLEVARVVRAGDPPSQPDVPPTFVDQVEILCSTPVVFTSVVETVHGNDRIVAPQDNVTLIIEGVNLDQLDGVSLVLGGTELAGTIVTPGASSMAVQFYFGGSYPVAFGSYHLVGFRADGLCADPTSLANPDLGQEDIFFVFLNGENLLFNGNFEYGYDPNEGQTPCGDKVLCGGTGGGDCRTGNCAVGVETIPGWKPVPFSPTPHCPKLNGSTHCGVNPLYPEGSNRGSIDGRGDGSAYQTRFVMPDKPLHVSGYFVGRTSDGKDSLHFFRLRDGADPRNSPVIGTYGQNSGGGWGFVEVTAPAPATDTVTVEWGFDQIGSDWVQAVATHVDDLVLIQTPTLCNDPKPDTDDDGDVDQDDFAVFQQCYTHTNNGVPSDPAYCFCLNHDADVEEQDDIDQSDLTAFEACASGPGILADPTCDNGWQN